MTISDLFSEPTFEPFPGSTEPSTLVELLRRRAIDQPRSLAYTFLVDGDTQEVNLTFSELDRQARNIGAVLQSMRASGERVLLFYPAGLEYLAAFFGCLYAGAIAVPTYPPRMNRNFIRLLAIMDDAEATIALTTASVLSKTEPLFDEEPRLRSMRWLATDEFDTEMAERWQEPAVKSSTLAFLQYTSGSTALPKGVMVSHGNLLANHRMLQAAWKHPEDAPYVSWLPLFHDMGLIGNALQTVYLGVACVFMSPLAFLQRPFRWLQAITRYRAATSGGPNFAFDLCVQKITDEQRATLDLSSWRLGFNGSEPVRKQTLERFSAAFEPCGLHPTTLYPGYGLAEATLFVSGGTKGALPIVVYLEGAALEENRVVLTSPGSVGARASVACGQTWGDQQIAIVNPETLTRCAADEVGEIWLSGSNITQGYWNKPEQTEHTFRAFTVDKGEGPFFRTGDLGFLMNGELFITGRLKDLIIIDGSNYYPQDIEQAVEESHPAIRPHAVAAFSVEADDEERLIVLAEVESHYRPEPGQSEPVATIGSRPLPLPKAITRAVRRAVAERYDLNVHAIMLLKRGSIPKTSSGKIQRSACRERFLDGTLRVWGE